LPITLEEIQEQKQLRGLLIGFLEKQLGE
jgi:hypothetical protein